MITLFLSVFLFVFWLAGFCVMIYLMYKFVELCCRPFLKADSTGKKKFISLEKIENFSDKMDAFNDRLDDHNDRQKEKDRVRKEAKKAKKAERKAEKKANK